MSELSEWQVGLRAFITACDAAPRGDEARQVRAARALLSGAPEASSFCPELLPSEAAIETMLAAGAGESAVLAMLTPGTALLLSKGGDGAAMASVALPDRPVDHSATGETLALALLVALARALLNESADADGFVQRLDRGISHSLN